MRCNVMTTKEKFGNQANTTTVTIPRETIERAVKDGKFVLLKDEEQKEELVNSITKHIVDPGDLLDDRDLKYFARLRTVDYQGKKEKEKENLDELDKYINTGKWTMSLDLKTENEKSELFHYYNTFHTLHIKDISSCAYKENLERSGNAIAVKLDKLKGKMKNKKSRSIIVINFRGKVPCEFEEEFQGKYEEIDISTQKDHSARIPDKEVKRLFIEYTAPH
ncbi:MAG: hypothetical protein JYX80_06950 [Candidatus Scalindua sediminis]|nr:hypothetical protein [Candidatus Scalindua sediminis]